MLCCASCSWATIWVFAFWQERIAAIAANGGGTLTLTAGVYRTGALFFKPGVNLHLEKGAVILGVDEALQLPHKLVDPIPLTIVDHDGVEHSVSFRKHGTTGSENYGNYRIPMEETGVLRYDRLGNATVGICSARGAFDLVYRVLTRSPEDPVNCEKDIEKEYYL